MTGPLAHRPRSRPSRTRQRESNANAAFGALLLPFSKQKRTLGFSSSSPRSPAPLGSSASSESSSGQKSGRSPIRAPGLPQEPAAGALRRAKQLKPASHLAPHGPRPRVRGAEKRKEELSEGRENALRAPCKAVGRGGSREGAEGRGEEEQRAEEGARARAREGPRLRERGRSAPGRGRGREGEGVQGCGGKEAAARCRPRLAPRERSVGGCSALVGARSPVGRQGLPGPPPAPRAGSHAPTAGEAAPGRRRPGAGRPCWLPEAG